jgi:tyrosyl-tRNA synthetase
MKLSPAESLQLLTKGADTIISEQELLKRLSENRPLRVKLGVDPTAPDLHLGHAVGLRKLRQFQELGHQAVLIIGDFTATIGDPSGRSATRPPLTREEVMTNAKTFTDQAFLILDREKTEIQYNGQWFGAMNYHDILRLNSRVTLQQMLQREDFRGRLDKGQEVRLHEIQYPVMQGWDSVVIKADVELGGTDQLFNILVGRDFQKAEGQPPQIVMTLPLLEGLDGVKKMSKSLGNYVGLTDAPGDMFGKLMSIPDSLLSKYYLLVLAEDWDSSQHPMEAKKNLAARCVALYHGEEAAAAARAGWDVRFSQRDMSSAELPTFCPDPSSDVVTTAAAAFAALGVTRSNSQVRDLIKQGAIRLDEERLSDPKATPVWPDGAVLRLDKTRAVRILLSA